MKPHHFYISAALTAILIATPACSKSQSAASDSDINRAVAAHAATPKFSGDSAFNFVKQQVDFGPRVPGTAPHAACHDFIAERLQSYGAKVELLDTLFANPSGNKVEIRNILGHFNPDARQRIMLVAHYDTRPWADRDPDPAAYKTPIDGANDGASGVGVMLEIARLIAAQSPKTGVDMLFVDYEDSGSYSGPDEEWCLGSQAYAASLTPGSARPSMAILLDMVGGPDAIFPIEYFSAQAAPEVVDLVWRKADEAGQSSRFVRQMGGAINDDHVYLLKAGIPAIDIIECANDLTGSFNPTWHTLDDNIKNIDRATLQAVGDVITSVVYTL